jgi:hypothetical protein
MDEKAINRAMNDKRLAQQIRPTEPGSWTRLLERALGQPQGWGGYDLVSLLTVAYEIGYEDGGSERAAYPQDDQGRELLCPKCGGPWSEGYPQEVLDG